MGASFVPVPSLQEGSGDGYAKEMDADAAALARALYAEEAAKSDIVITTANIPGRRSPILLDEAAVAAMAPGSVIVDMAAATGHYIVLILAVILGFYVISNVTPALHTPLMSVTNAISGIILIGAISQIGDPHPLIAGASFIAIVLACVNIFGGFTVTHRMLAMFRK